MIVIEVVGFGVCFCCNWWGRCMFKDIFGR